MPFPAVGQEQETETGSYSFCFFPTKSYHISQTTFSHVLRLSVYGASSSVGRDIGPTIRHGLDCSFLGVSRKISGDIRHTSFSHVLVCIVYGVLDPLVEILIIQDSGMFFVDRLQGYH